jgi:uncharacterized protein YndB with AHSA1/START domain
MSTIPFKPQGELVLTRIFDAPRELVFKVWTDPKCIPLWWGPHGFTTTVQAMDVRAGGAWRFTMRGPDGNDYPFVGEYVEVQAPERIVFVGQIHAASGHDVWTEILFADEEGKTKVTVHQVFAMQSAATRGAPIGWSQQLDRLETYLAAI